MFKIHPSVMYLTIMCMLANKEKTCRKHRVARGSGLPAGRVGLGHDFRRSGPVGSQNLDPRATLRLSTRNY